MQSRTTENDVCNSLVDENTAFSLTSNHLESAANHIDHYQTPFLSENQQTPVEEVPNIDHAEVKDETLPDPPDGGYGWFVVLASFIIHIIIGTMERSEGLFFLQFQAKYGLSAQVIAWPGAISSTLRLLVGPIASAFSNRYSVRSCTLVGSLLLFLAIFITSVTPNFFVLFLSHGVLEGFANGLIYAPSLIIIGMYFDKRRGFAAGLACSGVGIGTFVFLPLIQLAFDLFGLNGAFLILSAWSLHSAVAAMLQRPLSLYYRFTLGQDFGAKRHEDEAHEDVSAITSLTNTTNSNTGSDSEPRSRSSKCHTHSVNAIKSSSPQRKTHVCKNWLIPSIQICFPIEDSRFAKQTKKKVFHFYLLKTPSFLLFCIAIMMFTGANKASFTFLPALIKSKGFTDTEAALVISIMGAFDTVGRISTGLIFDFVRLRPFRPLFYNLFLLMITALAFALPSLESYLSYAIICPVYGLLCGAYISQKSVIIVDILGPQHMASSFGMLIAFQGMGAAIGPPLSGLFRDIFGSFAEVFYLGGGMMLLAGLFMVFSNIFLKRQRSKSPPKNISRPTSSTAVSQN